MLAQFQSLYPNACLISELVQIFGGKYIVRASVNVEGVTRATGMAAAETVEAAEDQARNRALMILGVTNIPQNSVAFSPQPKIPPNQISSLSPSSTTGELNQPEYYPVAETLTQSETAPIAPVIKTNTTAETFTRSETAPIAPGITKIDTYSPDLSQRFGDTNNQEIEFEPPQESWGMMSSSNHPEELSLPRNSSSNVTPFTPRNYQNQDELATPTTKRKKRSEPVDLSDVIAKTEVHIERLGWTKEQGKEHLKKTYNKLGRTLLNEEELLDFLRYLELQPDPIAGF